MYYIIKYTTTDCKLQYNHHTLMLLQAGLLETYLKLMRFKLANIHLVWPHHKRMAAMEAITGPFTETLFKAQLWKRCKSSKTWKCEYSLDKIAVSWQHVNVDGILLDHWAWYWWSCHRVRDRVSSLPVKVLSCEQKSVSLGPAHPHTHLRTSTVYTPSF